MDLPSIHCSLGFHRLAINGVDDELSNQPFFIDGIYLICNGEIYNHKEINKHSKYHTYIVNQIANLLFIYIKNMVLNKHYK